MEGQGFSYAFVHLHIPGIYSSGQHITNGQYYLLNEWCMNK